MMYILDKERARNLLLAQKFNPRQVDRLLEKYPPLPDTLGKLVEQWLEDQVTPEIVIDGVSLQQSMKLRHSHFLVAIRDLSKLIDPQLPQEKRDMWRQVLTSPVHYE